MIEIAKKSLCNGCSACVSICPEKCIMMQGDDQGFLYPVVDLKKCIKCQRCEHVCPVNTKDISVIGTVKAYAVLNRNQEQRMKSTSGGVFPLLAKKILEKDGIVFGAAYSENFQVKHIAVEKEEDLSLTQGAKYSQSVLKDTFCQIKNNLDKGRYVLFSGTPCQNVGLNSFLGKEYNNLVCVDLICHGVPSPMAWESYIKYRIKEDNENVLPEFINQRSKVSGWSNYGYSVEINYKDGKKYERINQEDAFMRAFISDLTLRPSCNYCKFKSENRKSDITLGDYWGIWNQNPEMDDNKGTSLVIVRTKKGEALFEEISNLVISQQVELEQAISENPSYSVATSKNEKRDEFLEVLNSIEFDKAVEKYCSGNMKKISLIERIKKKIFNC